MYSPATLNLSLHRRTDFALTVKLKDENGAAKDLTGWTVASSISTEYGAAVVDSFQVDTAQLASGEFTLSLSEADTEALAAGDYAWDCLVLDTDGKRSKVLKGCLNLHDTVTDP